MTPTSVMLGGRRLINENAAKSDYQNSSDNAAHEQTRDKADNPDRLLSVLFRHCLHLHLGVRFFAEKKYVAPDISVEGGPVG